MTDRPLIPRRNVLTEEIYGGKRTTCCHCHKAIKNGDTSIVCRQKRTNKVQARFCSTECQADHNDQVVDNLVDSELKTR